jgi:predicted PurR-regulated permease PerM
MGTHGVMASSHQSPAPEEGARAPLPGLDVLRNVEDAVRRGARWTGKPRRDGRADGGAGEGAKAAAERDALEVEAEERESDIGTTARRAAVTALVVLGIVVTAIVLWKARIVVMLLFLALTIAASIRPSVDALAARRVPRSLAVLGHYAVVFGAIGLFLWLIVPQAIDQVQGALGDQHTIGQAAKESTGIKHDLLMALDRKLRNLPSTSELATPAVEYGRKAFEAVIGIFFTLAAAAYWVFERDRAVDLVCSIVPRPKRKTVRDTWRLIDLKLGAFVRGQLLLVVFIGVLLSGAFWAIGLPYWLLVGAFGGIVEIVPVVGPIAAGLVAGLVGLTDSLQLALLAGLVVLVVRLLEDYVVVPRVLGHSVGLSPLVVLVSVTTVGIVLGGFAVVLAIPIASVAATLVDVVVRERDPAEETVPAVIFPAKDAE